MNTIRNAGPKEQRQTYFLVAGEVVMQLSEEGNPTAVRLNTIIMSKDGKFAIQQINQSHQALQFQFHKRAEDPTVKVLDVIILGLMNLGEFTATEFNAKPAGLDIREMSDIQVLT